MHFSGLDKMEGTKFTGRFSDVEFDYNTQVWCASIRPLYRKGGGPHHFCHKEREECIKWEKEYYDSRFA